MFPAHHNSLLFILRLTCCLAPSPWNLKQAHLGVLSSGETWVGNHLFRQTLLYLECITSILQLWLHSWGMEVGPWKGLGANFHCTEHSLSVGIELSSCLIDSKPCEVDITFWLITWGPWSSSKPAGLVDRGLPWSLHCLCPRGHRLSGWVLPTSGSSAHSSKANSWEVNVTERKAAWIRKASNLGRRWTRVPRPTPKILLRWDSF